MKIINNVLTLSRLKTSVTITAIETRSGLQLYCLAKTAVSIAEGRAVSIKTISFIISVISIASENQIAKMGLRISFNKTATPKNK